MTPEQARKLLDTIDALDIADLKDPEDFDALETIAGMRTEYAVQNRVGDKWLYEGDDGRNLAPYDSHRIAWWPDPIPQSDIADRGEGMARIVRRYVTAPQPLGENQ